MADFKNLKTARVSHVRKWHFPRWLPN